MIFFKKTKFNPVLFMVASLSAFFLLGFLYFVLFVNTLFVEIENQNKNIATVEQKTTETCVSPDDFDICDPYITKAPGWKK